jgi:hypothetical protein
MLAKNDARLNAVAAGFERLEKAPNKIASWVYEEIIENSLIESVIHEEKKMTE